LTGNHNGVQHLYVCINITGLVIQEKLSLM